jgi:hypothetical protein
MGKRIPNLIIYYDNEYGSEFRVQLEVPLSPDEATTVRKNLLTGTPETLKSARELVLSRVDSEAKPIFRQIMGQAFDANIKDAEDLERQRGGRR